MRESCDAVAAVWFAVGVGGEEIRLGWRGGKLLGRIGSEGW